MTNYGVLGSRPLAPEGPRFVALLGWSRCTPFMLVTPSRNSGEDGGAEVLKDEYSVNAKSFESLGGLNS